MIGRTVISALRLRALCISVMVLSLMPGLAGAVGLIAGWDQVVICRGDALITLTLDAEGRPVEVEQSGTTECLPAAASDASSGPAVHQPAADVSALVPGSLSLQVVVATPNARPPVRGPPV